MEALDLTEPNRPNFLLKTSKSNKIILNYSKLKKSKLN